jgi:hypothetical protein
MSQRERDVVKVMSLVLNGQRTGVEAGRLLGRSERQIRRIRRRVEKEGDAGVIHRLRGRPSNRRIKTALRSQTVSMCRKDLAGFGPTLAAEKLAERGVAVCSETLRGWLLAEGLWQRKRRRDRHRSRRPRKDCFGEMVQMDTSIHDWLEGRGESIVLTAMIDDATGRILARFYRGETTEGHMDLLGRWINKHGRPLSLYTDRDSIYRTEGRDGASRPTQLGRALKELDMELILAYSPQAKGRVERLFGTLQDRWVKELRLAKVRTLEGANALLEKELIPAFNRRFAVKAAGDTDAHRGWKRGDSLPAILSIQHKRTVGNDYTFRFANQAYQLLPPAWPGLRGGQVVIERRLDGSTRVRFRQRYLRFKRIELGALPPNPRLVSLHRQGGKRPGGTNRRAGRSKESWRPPASHPWRQGGHSYLGQTPDIPTLV